MPIKIKHYGWWPSLPDQRNLIHDFAGAEVAAEVDLRDSGFLPRVWDQGELGSCTAHGAPAALVFDLAKQGSVAHPDDFMPSRLFHYYFERVLEGTVSEDSGATITDAIKAMNGDGLPPESEWPYIIARFADKPPANATTDAVLREAVKYAQVTRTAQAMQACLTAGTPIVIGFTVYESFESEEVAKTGIVPMPGKHEQVLGGHCVLVVGYKLIEGKPYWILRNSWGTDWGDDGYFYMPEAYLTGSLASDFWTVLSVSSPDPAPVPPSPNPTPTPTPVPADADEALWSTVRSWAQDHHHTGTTKPIAVGLLAWAKAKGLT